MVFKKPKKIDNAGTPAPKTVKEPTALESFNRSGGSGRPELDELLKEICKKINL